MVEYVVSLHMDADIFHTPSQSKKFKILTFTLILCALSKTMLFCIAYETLA